MQDSKFFLLSKGFWGGAIGFILLIAQSLNIAVVTPNKDVQAAVAAAFVLVGIIGRLLAQKRLTLKTTKQ